MIKQNCSQFQNNRAARQEKPNTVRASSENKVYRFTSTKALLHYENQLQFSRCYLFSKEVHLPLNNKNLQNKKPNQTKKKATAVRLQHFGTLRYFAAQHNKLLQYCRRQNLITFAKEFSYNYEVVEYFLMLVQHLSQQKQCCEQQSVGVFCLVFLLWFWVCFLFGVRVCVLAFFFLTKHITRLLTHSVLNATEVSDPHSTNRTHCSKQTFSCEHLTLVIHHKFVQLIHTMTSAV